MRKRFILAVLILFCLFNVSGEDMEERFIEVSCEDGTVVFRLNESDAAKSLLAQLPMEVEISDFSTNEKIFYPEKGLQTENTPLAEGGKGVLAYYKPWKNVVMFYDSFRGNSSLFALGTAVEGEDDIQALRGTVTVSGR